MSVSASLQTGREVQVRDLARAQGRFLKEVLTTGVVIYQTDPAIRGRLISRMLGFVEDFQPIVSLPDTELLDTKIESLEHCVHRIESHIPSSASELEADYDRQDIISVNLQPAISSVPWDSETSQSMSTTRSTGPASTVWSPTGSNYFASSRGKS